MSEVLEGQSLTGVKIFPVLRYASALLNSPCPCCSGENHIDDEDVCLHVGHHQIPVCQDCLKKLPSIFQRAVDGELDNYKPNVMRHAAPWQENNPEAGKLEG